MSEWKVIKMKDVINRMFSGGTPTTTTDDYWNGDLPWLSSGETRKKYIQDTHKTITYLGVKESSTKLAKKNSVVIASAGQGKTRGQVSFLLNDMYINQSIISIEANEQYLLPEYLFFNLSSRYDEIRILSDASSSRGSITTKFLNRLQIKLPDVKIQETITNVLSAYDKLIENNNRRIEVLEQTMEEIYKEWFVRMRFPGYKNTKFDKGIPEGWEVRKVNEVVERFRYGTLYKQGNVEEEGEVIVIDQSEKEFLGYHNEKADHIADINNPFILFGDHSCKMLVMTKPFSLSENVIPFKSKDDVPELFLYYTVKDLIRTTEYKRHWSELTNKKILIPDLSLQLQFKNLIKNKVKLIQLYKDEINNLMKQRDLLLPRLMNGSIEVK